MLATAWVEFLDFDCVISFLELSMISQILRVLRSRSVDPLAFPTTPVTASSKISCLIISPVALGDLSTYRAATPATWGLWPLTCRSLWQQLFWRRSPRRRCRFPAQKCLRIHRNSKSWHADRDYPRPPRSKTGGTCRTTSNSNPMIQDRPPPPGKKSFESIRRR